MTSSPDQVTGTEHDQNAIDWSAEPLLVAIPYEPEGAESGGVVISVHVRIGEFVEIDDVVATIELSPDKTERQQVAGFRGVIVELVMISGGPAPMADPHTHTILNLQSSQLEANAMPAVGDFTPDFALDPAGVALPTRVPEQPASASGGLLSIMRRVSSVVSTKKTTEEIAAEAALFVRSHTADLIERARTSCYLRSKEEALIWWFTYGEDRSAGLQLFLDDLAMYTGRTADALTRSDKVGSRTLADMPAIAEELIGRVAFDWRRSRAFFESFLASVRRRLAAASTMPPGIDAIWRWQPTASEWYYVVPSVRRNFPIYLGQFYLYGNFVQQANTLLSAFSSPAVQADTERVHYDEAAWDPALFAELIRLLLKIEWIKSHQSSEFQTDGEDERATYPSFSVAWSTEVARAELLDILWDNGGDVRKCPPEKLIEDVHLMYGIALEFGASQSRHGMKRIDGTDRDEAQEMSAEEYADWCTIRNALSGMLRSWQVTVYPELTQELRNRLGTTTTVGQAELVKQEMTDLENQKSHVTRALEAYREADRCRAWYYRVLEDQESEEREAEWEAEQAERERLEDDSKRRSDQFWRESRERQRHEEIVDELQSIKTLGAVTAAGTVANLLKRR
jgi:hypothetical protein